MSTFDPRNHAPETSGQLVAAVISACVPMGRIPGSPATEPDPPAVRSWELDLSSLQEVERERATILSIDDIFETWG